MSDLEEILASLYASEVNASSHGFGTATLT
jgi:hypothetical protein